MRTGVVLDQNFDLVIRNGSFWPEPSAETESRLIVTSNSGNFRHAPEVGCNLETLLLDEEGPDQFEQVITEQHALDGLAVQSIIPTKEGFLVEFNEEG